MSTETSDARAEPTLIVPDGWVIDELTVARLERRLRLLPREVAAIVAPGGELPPGSSYRVHAERMALAGAPDPAVIQQPIRGAVLARDGVEAHVNDDGLVAVDGTAVVDLSAHVHDPWAPTGPIEIASPLGRSPFTRRPLVLFLTSAQDAELDAADWSRMMVNGLIRHDVEARLAREVISPGLQLSRPCLPVEATVHALRPDLVVCLDESALEGAVQWCHDFRETILIGYSLDTSVDIELLPWRLDDNSSRLRAWVGPAVDTVGFARLVNRLCSGPQPLPPAKDAVDVNGTPLPVPAQRSSATAARRTVGLVAPLSARLEALQQYGSRAGFDVEVASRPEHDAAAYAVAVLDATTPIEIAESILLDREQQGLRTVVDLDHLEDEQRIALASRSGFALVRGAEFVGPGSQITGASVQLLPLLRDPGSLISLSDARDLGHDARRTIGCALGKGSADGAALTALAHLLDRDPNLEGVAWHAATTASDPPTGSGIRVLATAPSIGELATFLAVLDTTSTESASVSLLVTDAAMLGVPTVFTTRDDSVDPIIGRFAVRPASATHDWQSALDEAVATSHGARARLAARAEALSGLKASTARARRVLGWATFGIDAR